MSSTGSTDESRADVELRVPADSAYVSVLRTTSAGLAARLDFTIDDIEDLRIAVGEASAMVLPSADEGSDLVCRYYLRPGEVSITVEVTSSDPELPEEDGFAWQVLSALTTETATSFENGVFSVTLTMNSTVNA